MKSDRFGRSDMNVLRPLSALSEDLGQIKDSTYATPHPPLPRVLLPTLGPENLDPGRQTSDL